MNLKFLLPCLFALTISASASADTQLNDELRRIEQLNSSDNAAAAEHIERLVALHPNHPEVHFLCGKVFGKRASEAFFLAAYGHAKQALACLQRAVDLDPSEPRYRYGLFNYYNEAPGVVGGDQQLAEHHLAELRKLPHKNAAILFRVGLILQQQHDYQAAAGNFSAALEHASSNAERLNALYQLGRNAVFAQRSQQQGIDYLQSYLETTQDWSASEFTDQGLPPRAWAHLRCAQLFLQLSHTPQAARHLDAASKTSDKELLALVKQLQKDNNGVSL